MIRATLLEYVHEVNNVLLRPDLLDQPTLAVPVCAATIQLRTLRKSLASYGTPSSQCSFGLPKHLRMTSFYTLRGGIDWSFILAAWPTHLSLQNLMNTIMRLASQCCQHHGSSSSSNPPCQTLLPASMDRRHFPSHEPVVSSRPLTDAPRLISIR